MMLATEAARLRCRSGTILGRLVVPLVWRTSATSSSLGSVRALRSDGTGDTGSSCSVPPSSKPASMIVPQLAIRQCETGQSYDGHALVVAGIQDVEQGRHVSSSFSLCRFQICAQTGNFARISEKQITYFPLSVKSIVTRWNYSSVRTET